MAEAGTTVEESGAARRRRPGPGSGGFTLIELMVVITIIGIMLLMLPARIDGFGELSKLDSSGNSVASAFTAARELAIIDGHETRIQFDLPGDTRDRKKTGRWRYMITTQKRLTPEALQEGNQPKERREEPAEEEWGFTDWRDLQPGVSIFGFSQEAGSWIRSNPRGDPIEVSFMADGSVHPACAVRIQSLDMEGPERFLTIRVNALTSTAEVVRGEAELPKGREPSDFR